MKRNGDFLNASPYADNNSTVSLFSDERLFDVRCSKCSHDYLVKLLQASGKTPVMQVARLSEGIYNRALPRFLSVSSAYHHREINLTWRCPILPNYRQTERDR